MTNPSLKLLQKLLQHVFFVPVTTRTEEQYKRISFGDIKPEYALVCNGGVLLEHGEVSKEWYAESLRMVQDCQTELAHALQLLAEDPGRNFEVRNIEQLFLFTKSSNPEATAARLRERLNPQKVNVKFDRVSEKLYVLPDILHKGTAVSRLRKLFGERNRADRLIAAGDSEFDVPMLQAADLALVPKKLYETYPEELEKAVVFDGNGVFSDWLLKHVMRETK